MTKCLSAQTALSLNFAFNEWACSHNIFSIPASMRGYEAGVSTDDRWERAQE